MSTESLSPAEFNHLCALAHQALTAWDIHSAELSLIKYRENAVFRVRTAKEQYALRLHRPGYHDNTALQSELILVDTLAGKGFAVANPIHSIDGRLLVETSHAGDQRQTNLLHWVEGKQLGELTDTHGEDSQSVRNTYRTIGEIAAQLHNHITGWQPPDHFQRHAWDENGLVGDSPFWGPFWELSDLSRSQLELVTETRQAIQRDLATYGKPENCYGLIHADFTPENLLVDGDNVRLIDFDDAGFGWHMVEIATALYFVQPESYFCHAKAALLQGYQQYRPLNTTDLQTLPMFLAARGFTYLGWVQSRTETQTAKEMTPFLIDLACTTAEHYLTQRQAN